MPSTQSHRNFLELAALSPVGAPLLAREPAKKPNLLFVFSDQQSRDMLGAYGHSEGLTLRTDAF